MLSLTTTRGESCRGLSKTALAVEGPARLLREAAVSAQQPLWGDDCGGADSGSENVNGEVDEVLIDEELTRVLAQVEVTFSNSLVRGILAFN